MANEGRNLINEAVADAKALREAAHEAAKKELIERMAPEIKKITEKALRVVREDTDRIRRGVEDNWPGESHTGFEESAEKGEQKMDDEKGEFELESLFPGMSEEAEPEMKMEGEEQMEETKDNDADDEEKNMDETIELDEAALEKFYEQAMSVGNIAEVQVKKGFSDMTPTGELDDVVKDVDKGVADFKKGEHDWDKETPPAKQDFTVKEMIQRGLQENRNLKTKLVEAVKLIQRLRGTLHEQNIFNCKVLHVNRILNKHGAMLTNEQKRVFLETIDKAKTIDEVKMVYEAVNTSFATMGSRLTEGRAPKANAQKARKSGSPDPKVLSESVDREQHSAAFGRMKHLAGLVK